MKTTNRREFLETAGIVAIGAGCLMGKTKTLQAEDQPEMPSKPKECKPCEKVMTSGVYDVLHDKLDGADHAEIHQVIAIAGTVFPHCKSCREWVRFRLIQKAEFIGSDTHFQT